MLHMSYPLSSTTKINPKETARIRKMVRPKTKQTEEQKEYLREALKGGVTHAGKWNY